MSQTIINPYAFGAPAPPVGGQGTWIELDRTTLGSAGDSITVSNLPKKEFYMILVNIVDSADIQLNLRLGAGSVDSGANYASRDSNNGAADVSRASQNQILLSLNSATSLEQFGFGYISNLQGQEKLVSYRNNMNQDGQATGTFRSQVAGKWSNVNPLDTISLENLGTGTFPIGSELVVLGFSRFDDGLGTNFWQLLGEATAGGGETTVQTPIFPKKKYLFMNYQFAPVGASGFSAGGRFGDTTPVTSSSYDMRSANAGLADGLFTSTGLLIGTSGNSPSVSQFFYLNKAATEKLLIGQGTSDRGAIVPPPNDITRNMVSGKNSNATLKTGQIDIANMFRSSGVDVFAAGSKITVWGSD